MNDFKQDLKILHLMFYINLQQLCELLSTNKQSPYHDKECLTHPQSESSILP
jgi:hypothetical protein